LSACVSAKFHRIDLPTGITLCRTRDYTESLFLVELAEAPRNLLCAHHQEFTVPPSDAISRGVFLDARWKF